MSLRFFMFVNRCTNSIILFFISDFFYSRAVFVNTSKRTWASIQIILATITSLLFKVVVLVRE